MTLLITEFMLPRFHIHEERPKCEFESFEIMIVLRRQGVRVLKGRSALMLCKEIDVDKKKIGFSSVQFGKA